MSYETAPFSSFGAGLNLRDKTDVISEEEAIDLLNVIFTERGSIRQRDGFEEFTSSALTNAVGSLHVHYRAGSNPHVLAGCGTRLEAIDSAGAVVASETTLTDGTWDFARFGSPNNEISYAGQGTDVLRSWDGSAWATVTGAPRAGALAVMSPANRLVASRFNGTTGGPGGATSSPSHVYFSDVGDPETWTSDNFVQLTPGDGEAIQAVIEWREFVFVFKETKFFVFYGESEGAAGTPVFDYRTVDADAGLAASRAVAISDEGVYFMDRRGIFITTGGEPTRLSDPVEPIWLGVVSAYFTGSVLDHSNIENCAMGVWDDRIYLSFTGSGSMVNDFILVHDPHYGWWSLYDVPATGMTPIHITGRDELLFGFSTGDNHIGVHNHEETVLNDNGAAISSKWRSGWFNYGIPDQKTIRETKVWGTGEPFMAISQDYEANIGQSVQLPLPVPDTPNWNEETWNASTWGGSPGAVLPFLRRKSTRGTMFSVTFTNAILDQGWSMVRLIHHLREQRPPSKLLSRNTSTE